MKSLSIILAICLALSLMISIANAQHNTTPSDKTDVLQVQDIKTSDQLDSYVAKVKSYNSNQMGSRNISDELATTITFSKYLTFNELEKYAREYALTIKQVQVRGIEEDGTRITVFALANTDLSNVEANVLEEAATNNFEIVGITDIYAYVNSNNLMSISDDMLTYLADTSGNNMLSSANINNVMSANTDSKIFPKSLTWELEDLEILK